MPVPDVVLLLVVPEAVPLVVRLGTPVDNVGTPLDSVGTPLESVGTPLDRVGTDGTLGPPEPAVPAVDGAGVVITVVTPPAVVDGMTVVPRTAAEAPVVAGVVVVVVVVPVDGEAAAALGTMRGAPPSGRTQFTSRLEQ